MAVVKRNKAEIKVRPPKAACRGVVLKKVHSCRLMFAGCTFPQGFFLDFLFVSSTLREVLEPASSED